MGLKLDDNSRSGFHYLGLGLLLILALRLGWNGLHALSYRDVANEERVFRGGYLGLESVTTVNTRYTPVVRIVSALGISCITAIILAVVSASIGHAGRTRRFRITFWLGMLALLPWVVWASLFCPPKSAFFTQDGVFLQYHRTLVADLPLPCCGTEQAIPSSEVLALYRRDGQTSPRAGTHVPEIVMRTAAGEEMVGNAWSGPEPHAYDVLALDSLSARLVHDLRQLLAMRPGRAEQP